MATKAIYNGVVMEDVLTRYHDEIVYDPTGVDPIATKTVVDIETVIHIQTALNTLGVNVGGDLASGMDLIKERLLTPRRRFQVIINGSSFIDVSPLAVENGANTTVAAKLSAGDCDNGPKTSLRTSRVVSSHSMHVVLQVTVVVAHCDKSAKGILSHRWWITDDYNEDMMCQRRYEGVIRMAARLTTPHAFRNLTIPPLLSGFKPQGISLRESQDGLKLEYTIVYQEFKEAPPWPATKWRVSFMASTPKPGGLVWDEEVRVHLQSSRAVEMNALHSLAVKIIESKIRLKYRLESEQVFLRYYAINEEIHDRSVDHTARIQLVGDASGATGIMNLVLQDIGKPIVLPGYDRHTFIAPPPTASAGGLFYCALQDACQQSAYPTIFSGKIEKIKKPKKSQAEDPQVVYEVIPNEKGSNFSQEHLKGGLYTNYLASSQIIADTGNLTLPVGKSSTGKSTSTTVKMHQGSARRIVTIKAQRLSAWPTIPTPTDFTDSNGIRHSVLSWKPETQGTTLSADGRKTLHETDFVIEYGLSRPPAPGESLPGVQLPYVSKLGSSLKGMPANFFENPKAMLE